MTRKENQAMPEGMTVPISRCEAFELGWQLSGALRHCQDGRDLDRVLTAEGCEKIRDLGGDLGIHTRDSAMVMVKRRIIERLTELDLCGTTSALGENPLDHSPIHSANGNPCCPSCGTVGTCDCART